MRRLAVAAAFMLATSLAGAQTVIYRWVDKQGVVHFSDDINQVPEPYASMYQARIREIEERRAAAVGDRKTPIESPSAAPRKYPTIPDVTATDAARRNYWQGRVKTWRTSLADATKELAAIDDEVSALNLNPVLRTTPKVRSELAAVQERRRKVHARVEAARKMLVETIPKEAKKEGVPSRWLR
ncbi:MAG: DUF4124 domain-containing protein [Myxococcota bacterium]